jgi:ABC-type sugar transport system ATPase subunit
VNRLIPVTASILEMRNIQKRFPGVHALDDESI